MAAIQNLKFTIPLNNFGLDISRSMQHFVGEWIWCELRREVVWKSFSYMVPMITKTKDKRAKNKNFENIKQTKWPGDMVDKYIYPKFGDSFIRGDDVYGRRTPRLRHDSSSAVQ